MADALKNKVKQLDKKVAEKKSLQQTQIPPVPPVPESEWQISTVDAAGDVGEYSSLAVDPNGNPHIAYFDSTNKSLKYAKLINSQWIVQTVDYPADSSNKVGQGCSLVLDSNGNPHISYFDTRTSKVKYAHFYSTWTLEFVDTGDPNNPVTSIVLDSNGNPHIALITGSGIKYANRNFSGSWTIQQIINEPQMIYRLSLALDSNNIPYVAYAITQPDNVYIKCVTWKDSAWVSQTIDTGISASIAISSNGYIHIAYYENSSADLKYASSGDIYFWSNVTIDSTGFVGAHPSITLDKDGKPVISYFDGSNSCLKYANLSSQGTWSTHTIDVSPGAGYFTSIKTDSNNNILLSYQDSVNKDLKYAKRQLQENNFPPVINSLLASTTVVTPISQSTLTCNAFDNDGSILTYAWSAQAGSISGSGQQVVWTPPATTSGTYKVSVTVTDSKGLSASQDINIQRNSLWKISAADSNWYVGTRVSLAIAADGTPHILYYDETHCWIKYARRVNSTWYTTVLDTVGLYSQYDQLENSIALDSGGNPHIAYLKLPDQAMYATCSTQGNGQWISQVIDTVTTSGWDCSIKVDTSGNPCVAFTPYYFSTWSYTTGWTRTQINSLPATYISLSITTDNVKHIVSDAGSAVVYIKWDGSAWATQVVSSIETGLYCSIKVDRSYKPHIIYGMGATNSPRHARYLSGSLWQIENVGNSGEYGGYSNSLEIDSTGNLHVAYFTKSSNVGLRGLMYKKKADTTWFTEMIANQTVSIDNIKLCDIALNPSGNPCIAYYDNQFYTLKFAEFLP